MAAVEQPAEAERNLREGSRTAQVTMPVQETFWRSASAWSPTLRDSLDGHCEKPLDAVTAAPARARTELGLRRARDDGVIRGHDGHGCPSHHRRPLEDRVRAAHRGLARLVRDVGPGGELAQDALVTALEQWPRSGSRTISGAWLMARQHRASIICDASGMLAREA